MKRITADELHKKWVKSPTYRREYNALEEEFSLTSALIEARSAQPDPPFVPCSCPGLVNMDEITGGAPYGATTMVGADGSPQPTKNELDVACFQGRHFAELTAKLVR
jgi:multimeric flavodoxin WrbA